MNGNMLVVDDGPQLLEIMGDALKRYGHHADMTQDVASAVRMLEEKDYDVLVIDKNMPNSDGNNKAGMKVLQHLRRLGIRTEAIMITGYARH